MVFAKNPLVNRIKNEMPAGKPFTIITGSDSWVNSISDFQSVQDELSSKTLSVLFVEDAGHHVHADQPDIFNEMILSICGSIQSKFDERYLKGFETRI